MMEIKIALITGASSGIGRALARFHASQGGNLVIVARNKQRLNQLKAEIEKENHVKVMTIAKDLSLANAPQEIYDEVKANGIEIDYLINDAGLGGRGMFHEHAAERDIQMITVNIIALTKLTKLFLPDFIRRGDGKVLNVSSTGALVPGPMQAVYCATKAYVTSFGNAIWKEIEGTGVTLTTLMPGATETEFAKIADMQNTPLFARTVSPVDVARAGYEGMILGKINVIAGISVMQRVILSLAPFIPKRILLNQVYNMQTENK